MRDSQQLDLRFFCRLFVDCLVGLGMLTFTACGGGGSQSSVQPPLIHYGAANVVCTKGTAIAPDAAINTGGPANSYSIQPALPTGLSLDVTTGTIGGTPTVITAQATYVVTASNAGGTGHTSVSITVNDVAPAGLTYRGNPVTYAVGAAITPNVPSWSNAGGTPTNFTGNLPSGLTVDPATGVISGTPTQAVNVNNYQIAASNSGGSTSATISITVIPQAPSIATQPASQAVGSGTSTYLNVLANGGGILSYQWYKNSVAIPGSNNSVYQTQVLTNADNGDQFYVVVSDNYNRSVTSNVASITIKGVSGTFVNTGTPAIARDCETATLLQNGQVLIVGGRNGNTTLASAELYDPSTGGFTPTGPLAAARCGHSATLLGTGQVLIAGGYYVNNGNGLPSLASAELYDPSTGTFLATGSLGTGRSGHNATLLANGKVLIADGLTSPDGFTMTAVASAELYDPASGVFSYTGSLNTARVQARSVLLNNGKVLIMGGVSGLTATPVLTASAEIYDPAAGTFSNTGSLATARTSHGAVLLQNGKVVVAGGINYPPNSSNPDVLASAELYDPSTGTFTTAAPLNFPRELGSATLLPSGQALILGGFVIGPSQNVTELYDPVSGVFIVNSPTNSVRFFGTATLLNNGQVLIEGQETSAISITQPLPAELYNP